MRKQLFTKPYAKIGFCGALLLFLALVLSFGGLKVNASTINDTSMVNGSLLSGDNIFYINMNYDLSHYQGSFIMLATGFNGSGAVSNSTLKINEYNHYGTITYTNEQNTLQYYQYSINTRIAYVVSANRRELDIHFYEVINDEIIEQVYVSLTISSNPSMVYYVALLNYDLAYGSTVVINTNNFIYSYTPSIGGSYPNIDIYNENYYYIKELKRVWGYGEEYITLITFIDEGNRTHELRFYCQDANENYLKYYVNDTIRTNIFYRESYNIIMIYNETGLYPNLDIYIVEARLNNYNELEYVAHDYLQNQTQSYKITSIAFNTEETSSASFTSGTDYTELQVTDQVLYNQLNKIRENINTKIQASYQEGYEDGQANLTAFDRVWTFLSGVFGAVGTIFTIELFPNVPLGLFILIPLVFGAFGFILWIWKGKN